jgi:hypothetical protein
VEQFINVFGFDMKSSSVEQLGLNFVQTQNKYQNCAPKCKSKSKLRCVTLIAILIETQVLGLKDCQKEKTKKLPRNMDKPITIAINTNSANPV